MEGAIFFFFCIVAVIIAAAFFISYGVRQSSELDDIYARVARRLGGRASAGGFFGRPMIRFQYRGAYAMVDIYSTGGKNPTYYTQLHLTWPDQSLRIEVYPERFVSRVGKFFGMADIQIGSPQFDELYLISGNDEAGIRHLLTADVQSKIDRLRSFLGNDDIYFGISRGQLLVKKRSLIRDYNMLERFIRLSLELYDAATATNAAGIDFVDNKQEASLSLEEAMCQICGDQITEDAVFCRSCKTPHHKDCWEYYGECSTYGCGQTTYLVPRKTKRATRRPK